MGADLDILVSEDLHFRDDLWNGYPTLKVGTVLASSTGESLHITDGVPTIDFNINKSISETIHFHEGSVQVLIDNYGRLEIADPTDPLGLYDLLALTGTAEATQLDIDDLVPEVEISGSPGYRGILNADEPLEQVVLSGKTEVIAQLVFNEPTETWAYLFHGTPGNMGSIVVADSLDTILISGVMPAHAVLDIDEPVGDLWMHGLGVPITYIRKTVVMNISNLAVTEYKNYGFNTILNFNGILLGLNNEGIFILGGDTDLGQYIQARIKSGTEDLAKSGVFSIPREAWASFRSDVRENALQLDIRIGERKDLFPYRFGGNNGRGMDAMREHRAKLGRGIKARYFTWDLKNMSGAKFTLESLRILGDIIRRKTR